MLLTLSAPVVLLSILLSQAPPQSSAVNSEALRPHINQDQLCCIGTNFVKPIYSKEARLAHAEGVVKLILVIASDGSIADLEAVSGNPLLLDSTMKAVRQWRFTIGGFVGQPRETEVPLSFTFKIEDPPKPAYLHLTNGKVVRVDEVREFTDGIEYTVGLRTRHISSNSVADINGCFHVRVLPLKEGDCIPDGGPSFSVHAIPLLPTRKTSAATGHFEVYCDGAGLFLAKIDGAPAPGKLVLFSRMNFPPGTIGGRYFGQGKWSDVYVFRDGCIPDDKCESIGNGRVSIDASDTADKGDSPPKSISGKYEIDLNGRHLEDRFVAKYHVSKRPVRLCM